MIALLKAHIKGYARRDGTFVLPHEDRRRSAQIDLFKPLDTGGDQVVALPYASGMSRRRDLDAAISSAAGVGTVITELSRAGMERVAEAVADGKSVFVDSGAFPAFKAAMKAGEPERARLDFERVLGRYDELSRLINERAPSRMERSLAMFVAPDVVGDQTASLELLETYRDRVARWIDDGHEVVVPFQRGPLNQWDVFLRVRDLLGDRPFVVGIPSSAEAMSSADLRELLTKPYKPERLHILGAVRSKRFEDRMAVIRELYENDVPGVTADANLMRARLHELYGLQGEAKVRAIRRILNDAAPDIWGGKVETGYLVPAERAMPADAPAERNAWVHVNGVSRYTMNSAGGLIHPTAAGVRNFWRWFGNSRVVDENGDAKVMYHGAPLYDGDEGFGDIDAFDRNHTVKTRKGRKPSLDTIGSWFSDNPGEGGAGMYAGRQGRIYPVYLNIRRPYRTSFYELARAILRVNGDHDRAALPDGKMRLWEANMDPEAMRLWLRRNGYDGIQIQREPGEFADQDVWIALDANQVKSAVGNDGGFDPKSPLITKSAPIVFARHPEPHEPTPAQLASGRYPKRAVPWKGLTVRIENEAGTFRRGRKPDGSEWETLMPFAYGEIARSEGVDGDPVDIFLGPHPDEAPMVFVVHQRRVGRWHEYDEDKCMVGFLSEADARDAFLASYDDPRFLGPISAMPVEEFIAKVRATRTAPAMIKAAPVVVFFKSHVHGPAVVRPQDQKLPAGAFGEKDGPC